MLSNGHYLKIIHHWKSGWTMEVNGAFHSVEKSCVINLINVTLLHYCYHHILYFLINYQNINSSNNIKLFQLVPLILMVAGAANLKYILLNAFYLIMSKGLIIKAFLHPLYHTLVTFISAEKPQNVLITQTTV